MCARIIKVALMVDVIGTFRRKLLFTMSILEK